MSNRGLIGKTTKTATDAVSVISETEVARLWGEMPAVVISFDSVKQTATVQPLYMPLDNGKPVSLPQLESVPVRFDRVAKGGLTYPVNAGDKVNLRPQMRSTDNYHTGSEHIADDVRMMHLSDMEAYIDGGESLTDPIVNFDADNLHLRFNKDGSFGLHGSEDGRLNINLISGELIGTLAELCEALASNKTQVNGGSSAGTHNHTQTLVIQQLATKLRAMVL